MVFVLLYRQWSFRIFLKYLSESESPAGLINAGIFFSFLLTCRHARMNTKHEKTVTFHLYLSLANPAAVSNLPGWDQKSKQEAVYSEKPLKSDFIQ